MPEEKKKQEKKNLSFLKSNKYEKFRESLKVNFYYGSLSRSDEKQTEWVRSLGTTQYNDYKNKVEKIAEDKITFPKHNKRKSFKYNVTQFESDYNALANSFQLKTITALETSTTIFILLLLANKPMTVQEILDTSGGATDEKTAKGYLKNMLENGLISKSGKEYTLSESCFYAISETALLRLLNMADFMKNLVYPEACGYNLFTLLKDIYEERTGSEYYSPFQFKYSHLANILDDNVLWSLIEAIEKRQAISFTYCKKKKENIIPVKLFTENEYNRRYLFAVTREPFKFYIFRLSEIYDLQVIGKKEAVTEEEFESFLEAYQAEKDYSFAGKIDSSAKTDTIKLKFKNSRKVKEQLKRDFNCIKFEKDNTAVITVKGKKMIKPYLRANMELIETTDKQLSGLIDSEIEEMKRNYGII